MTKEAQLKQIVAEHQYAEIDGVVVDATSASLICQVIDGLNEKNKAKYLALPIGVMADFAFSLAS